MCFTLPWIPVGAADPARRGVSRGQTGPAGQDDQTETAASRPWEAAVSVRSGG
jgi:hypothetical protein